MHTQKVLFVDDEPGILDYFKKPANLKLLKAAAQAAFEKQNRWKKG
jgi:hypothetical protein